MRKLCILSLAISFFQAHLVIKIFHDSYQDVLSSSNVTSHCQWMKCTDLRVERYLGFLVDGANSLNGRNETFPRGKNKNKLF